MDNNTKNNKNVVLLVIVASLGYFVDIYDLLVFSIVRVTSLTQIGVTPNRLQDDGLFIINMQMVGLFLGGILWGIIGDKYGRVKVLFGSILLYSLANIANGFVGSVNSYAWIRFIAGIGLAGELGAGITLVTETMGKKNRGYGTMVIGGMGFFGAGAAVLVAKHYTWETSYFVGGALGLLLLVLRMGTFESNLFKHAANSNVSKGNILLLFNRRDRFFKYLSCILMGSGNWFVLGILITFSPEIGKALGSAEPLNAGTGVMYSFIGLAIGSILCGFLAQILQSRKKAILIFLALSAISGYLYLTSYGLGNTKFIYLTLFLGIGLGYFTTLVTVAAEQFGTNIRATVSSTVPNFIRALLIPITYIFKILNKNYGILTASLMLMTAVIVIAMLATISLKESFDKDLDYIEE